MGPAGLFQVVPEPVAAWLQSGVATGWISALVSLGLGQTLWVQVQQEATRPRIQHPARFLRQLAGEAQEAPLRPDLGVGGLQLEEAPFDPEPSSTPADGELENPRGLPIPDGF